MIYLKFPNGSSDNRGCGVDTLGILSGEIESIAVGDVLKIATVILDGVVPDMQGICELEVQ